ncbi:MAG TPA: spiro-SPASM protein [Termitinemataceae bacterium]|nr:spiro-SPASM protein [Termitinemataceae bacterium]HOM23854.1 spiro-SPASM protein [Termitinemataceae bacterium]HPP99882.1 spiro-SPASM protein [Termitinemataceae bacterium]
MNAIAILFAGNITPYAFEPLENRRQGEKTEEEKLPPEDSEKPGSSLVPSVHGNSSVSALEQTLERVSRFPFCAKIALLCREADVSSIQKVLIRCDLPVPVTVQAAATWDVGSLLDQMIGLSQGMDALYYAWADTPFMDPQLAASMIERHRKYRAEYTNSDGWPSGLAPEIIAPGILPVLRALLKEERLPVERDSLFQVLQRDINAFDIETEISPVDLRPYRLSLSADTKRNYVLLQSLSAAGLTGAGGIEDLLIKEGEQLRTLPAFYSIQITRHCPQECSLCPYPRLGKRRGEPITAQHESMELEQFTALLDRIVAFSDDAYIDISLWGEPASHPQIKDLIQAILDRPSLSGIIETSGIGWDPDFFPSLRRQLEQAAPRPLGRKPLYFILSLDSQDPARYQELRGPGYKEAQERAHQMLELFPEVTYFQALRIQGNEDDIERFYRYWKDKGGQVIIQKYDYFCGYLEQKRAGDISPLVRRPCWHLMRDMHILIDGSVPLCRESIDPPLVLGNVFQEGLAEIWERGNTVYRQHLKGSYTGICKDCDEYYTYNF